MKHAIVKVVVVACFEKPSVHRDRRLFLGMATYSETPSWDTFYHFLYDLSLLGGAKYLDSPNSNHSTSNRIRILECHTFGDIDELCFVTRAF